MDTILFKHGSNLSIVPNNEDFSKGTIYFDKAKQTIFLDDPINNNIRIPMIGQFLETYTGSSSGARWRHIATINFTENNLQLTKESCIYYRRRSRINSNIVLVFNFDTNGIQNFSSIGDNDSTYINAYLISNSEDNKQYELWVRLLTSDNIDILNYTTPSNISITFLKNITTNLLTTSSFESQILDNSSANYKPVTPIISFIASASSIATGLKIHLPLYDVTATGVIKTNAAVGVVGVSAASTSSEGNAGIAFVDSTKRYDTAKLNPTDATANHGRIAALFNSVKKRTETIDNVSTDYYDNSSRWTIYNPNNTTSYSYGQIEFKYTQGDSPIISLSPTTNNNIILGNANYVWKNVYATTFTGDLDGTAAIANRLKLIYCRDDSAPTNKGLWNIVKNTETETTRNQVNFYTIYNTSELNAPSKYGEVLEIISYNTKGGHSQLWFDSENDTEKLYYRNKQRNKTNFEDWHQIAFTDDIIPFTNISGIVPISQGGTGRNDWINSTLVRISANGNLVSGYHYIDSSKIAINSTNEPTTNFYVNGTSQITGNTTIGGTLGVTKATTLSNTLAVTGATTLNSTLNVTGVTTLNNNLDIIVGNTDKFINFYYDTNKTSVGSWRLGYLGTGSGNTNYFVLQSDHSDSSKSTDWTSAISVGMNDRETTLYGGLGFGQTGGEGLGISLYNGYSQNATTKFSTYGIALAKTSAHSHAAATSEHANKAIYATHKTYGSVTGDWATYFTMSDNTNRGWIFGRQGTSTFTPVASISAGGNATFAGSLTVNSTIYATLFTGNLDGNATTASGLKDAGNGTNVFYYKTTASTGSANDLVSTTGYQPGIATVKNNDASTNGGPTSGWLTYLTIPDGTPFQLGIHDSSNLYFYKRWYSNGSWSSWSKMNAGNADTASKASGANLTTTTNAVAYYTNTSGTFGFKSSEKGTLYATSTNGELIWGILPTAQGGSGADGYAPGTGDISLAILSYMNGVPMYTDPTFLDGTCSVVKYNNQSAAITVTRNTYSTFNIMDPGTNSNYVLRISIPGQPTSPGLGGFVQSFTAKANTTFVEIFRALLPSGYSFNVASNGQGDSYQRFFVTPTAGTGRWEWYAVKTICGKTGTFSTGGHIYITKTTTGNPTYPVNFYLSYCNIFDITQLNINSELLRTRKKGTNYYGILTPEGADDEWIRSTTKGFIPYSSNSTTGDSALGTSTWPWKEAHIKTINGYLNGRAKYVTVSEITPPATSTYYLSFTGGKAADTSYSILCADAIKLVNGDLSLANNLVVSGVITQGSDKNIKHNIQNIPEKYNQFYNSLQPKQFKYNYDTTERNRFGFIAQEVEEAYKEAELNYQDDAIIAKRDNNEHGEWDLNMMDIVPLNTWQIQKMKQEIELLKAEIAELRKLVKKDG